MDIHQLKPNLDCEVMLFIDDTRHGAKLRQLLALSLNAAVRVVSSVEEMHWSHPDPACRLLITDYANYQQHLGQAEWNDQLSQARVLILDGPDEEEKALCLLYCGVAGILPHQVPVEVLVKATKAILAGEFWFPRAILSQFVASHQKQQQDEPRTPGPGKMLLLNLSRREREVLNLLCQGASNEQIAESLYISIHTVKSHVRQILRKTNASNRSGVMKLMLSESLDMSQLQDSFAA